MAAYLSYFGFAAGTMHLCFDSYHGARVDASVGVDKVFWEWQISAETLSSCMICTIAWYALQQISNGVQVKDPSKAASASDADIKDLVQFRGEELKKDTLAEAKTDNKRYDQVSVTCCVPQCTPLFLIVRCCVVCKTFMEIDPIRANYVA